MLGLYFRYGRITVSTLESKLASAEKDVTRLTKALERSDKYIEELESELDEYRGKPGATRKNRDDKLLTNGDIQSRKYYSDSKVQTTRDYGKSEDNPSRRKLFSDDMGYKSSSGERSKYTSYDADYNDDLHASKAPNNKAKGTNGGKKKVTFVLDKNANSAMSFDLELPSPLKTSANSSGLTNGRASPVKGVLKKKSGANDRSSDGYSTDLSKTLEDSLSESYDRHKTDKYSKDDDLVYLKTRSRSSDRDLYEEKPHRKFSADDSMLSEPSDLDLRHARQRSSDYGSSRRSDDLDGAYYSSRGDKDKLDRHDLDDTQYIESELDELNISVTPEFTDCMKILNRAEKNVHTRDTDDDYTTRTKSSVDTNLDSAFRASTGSVGYKSVGLENDYLSSGYKSGGTDRLAASVDSYSRGRHMRSGSLDNLLNIDRIGDRDRPSSALPTTSNMYPPTSQSKYSGGLTTGRTSLTRTPSLDNILISRPDPLALKRSSALPGYLGSRLYPGENDGKLEVKSSTSAGNVPQPVAASHGILGSQIGSGVSNTGDGRKTAYDAVLDTRAQVYMGDTGLSKTTDTERKLPPTGRSTPTLPLTSTGMDFDKPTGSGRITPTIPTHSEYMSMAKTTTDKYSYTSTSTGRSTPTLTSNTDYSSRTNPSTQFTDFRSSGPSSLPTELMQKPPVGSRSSDPISGRSYPSSYSSTNPASHLGASGAYAANTGEGYSSLPSYLNNAGGAGSSAGDGRPPASLGNHADINRYSSSLGARTSDFGSDKHEYGASANYRSDSKYSSSSNVPSYNDQHYRDGTDFSNFSTKVAVNNPSNFHPSVMPSANSMSTSSTGVLSYPGSSYLASSLPSSISASTSYSTAHSVPLTHTTTSYTSSVPTSSYVSKPLEPITESGHYSYVSNMSGDYSSKNDTFALPEPKKRLFENSDDLEMSMSPIKSNRRY